MDIPTFAKMTDLSSVRANHTIQEIHDAAELAKRHDFACAFALPAHTPLLIDLLKDRPDILVGGTVGFPDGSATTRGKVDEARELVEMGVDELDVVVNITWLRSDMFEKVGEDLRAVISAVDKPVKVILECHYLDDPQIVAGCEVALAAGANYIKTGTGWAPTGATLHAVKLMIDTVAGRCKVKAAGGVRDLETMRVMRNWGVERFGLGVRSAIELLRRLG
jgi:deoxyribose-phosphate aldolase